MSGLFVMMVVAPVAGVLFAAMWVAWWVTADFVSTPGSRRTMHTAPEDRRRETSPDPISAPQLRIAR
ncbi:MAG TPA: hypothetical protein VIP78_06770 [Candidatus Dormibacteraeota bacterium]